MSKVINKSEAEWWREYVHSIFPSGQPSVLSTASRRNDFDRAYKEAVIGAIPNSYSGEKFAVHRDQTFFLELIQTPPSETKERRINIVRCKTVLVALRGPRVRKSCGTTERIRCFVSGQLGKKVDYPNRDTAKTETVMDRSDGGNGKWCLLYEANTYCDEECLKQKKRRSGTD